MIRNVSTSRKTNGKDGTLLHTVVAGIWVQAAFVEAGERERTLYLHIIHISEKI
jgi:hypothetical protein